MSCHDSVLEIVLMNYNLSYMSPPTSSFPFGGMS